MHIPLTEKLKAIPEFFGMRINEQPEYKIIERYDDVEVRQYGQLTLASVTLSGVSYKDFRHTAFEILAEYFFSEDPMSGEYMPMTAPILMEKSGDGWTMSFILPKKYDLNNVRRPPTAAISLRDLEPLTVVAFTYSGVNDIAHINESVQKFLLWLSLHPEFDIDGEMIVAQYDGPFVLPTVRKNEIWFRFCM